MKKIALVLLLLTGNIFFAQTPQDFFPTSDYNGTHFGRDVKISNDEILVSSTNPPTQVGGSGKVFLFKMTENTLQQTNAFYPDDALVTDNFGASISIENDLIAIGSPYHDANFENSGAVYLYIRINDVWEFFQKITAPDGAVDDHFGSYVKIHNNRLFISAPYDDEVQNSGENNGSVYCYDFNGSAYTFSQKITISGSQRFGSKIEAENDKIIISGYEVPTNGIFLTTYTLNNTSWVLQNTTPILGNLEEIFEGFCLSDNQLFIVSKTLASNGKVYVFNEVNNTWSLSDTITLGFTDQLYTKIEVSNETMLLGSTEYTMQMHRKFPLLMYKKVNGNWAFQASLYGVGQTGQDDYFGASIALNGSFAIIGAPQEGAISLGKAYYFDTTLHVNEFEKNSVYLYPNPSTDLVFIKNDSGNTILYTEIYSITESLLFTQKSNLELLSLANFPPGMYFVKLNFDEKITKTYKVVKK